MNFGNWVNNIDKYKNEFMNGDPYKHCIIDNFLDEKTFEDIYNAYPDIKTSKWHIYNNPIEIKWALDDFKNLPTYQKLINFLQSEETLKLFKSIVDIENLENDQHLHGAGIHCHPKGGKLDVHLDYSIHPISGKERRLNLIIYLNKHWEEEWNGALELWKPYENDKNPKECIKKIYPIYNRAVLFQTNNISLHGLPEIIKCPENEFRKSFAIYYVSEPTINAMTRYKAEYFPKPNEVISENLKKLYEIRKERRLSNSDIKLYLPDWKNMS